MAASGLAVCMGLAGVIVLSKMITRNRQIISTLILWSVFLLQEIPANSLSNKKPGRQDIHDASKEDHHCRDSAAALEFGKPDDY